MSAHLNRYAVIGNPVAHSQSPFIHTEFARATGEPITYDRVLCPFDGLAATLAAFVEGGGHGCNITVPFKFQAGAVAARVSARAHLAQAANVLRWDGDGFSAENTDGVGLVRDIEVNAGTPLAHARVLLVGAGGAGAGVLGPILDARPARVTVVNRTPAKAEQLAHRHASLAAERGVTLGVAAIDAPGSGFDVVINATATSLQGAASPIPAAALRPGALVLDLMYGPAAAPFLDWARAHGALARDGLGMLVEQAAFAFQVWRGVMPETRPVLAALRAKLGLAIVGSA